MCGQTRHDSTCGLAAFDERQAASYSKLKPLLGVFMQTRLTLCPVRR
jgi:hypothetical protein